MPRNSKTVKRQQLVARVAEHYEITEQEIAKKTDEELLFLVNKLELPDTAKPEGEPEGEREAKSNQRTRVIIHEQDGLDGHDDVVIGVNGNVAQIKREHEVELTDEQIHVLDNAVYRRFEPIKEKPGEYVERTVKRFNFSKLGPARLAA